MQTVDHLNCHLLDNYYVIWLVFLCTRLLLTLVNSPLQSVVTCFSVSTLEDPDSRRWLQASFVRVFLWIPLILSIRLWSAFQHLSCFSVVWHMSGLGWFGHHVPQQLILSGKQLSGPITPGQRAVVVGKLLLWILFTGIFFFLQLWFNSLSIYFLNFIRHIYMFSNWDTVLYQYYIIKVCCLKHLNAPF